jgi:hypothetical protein
VVEKTKPGAQHTKKGVRHKHIVKQHRKKSKRKDTTICPRLLLLQNIFHTTSMLFTESELIKIVTHKDTHATAKQAKDMQLLNDVYSVTNCNDDVFLFFFAFSMFVKDRI